MRIAILCNDRLALPATAQLLASGLVVSVGMTDRRNDTQAIVAQQCAQANVPLKLFGKKDFETKIAAWLQEHQPDVVLVKTFPWQIPETALGVPKHGFINFHYAPLPLWRGSNPLFWMIRNRASAGGVAVHRMEKDFDSGPILLQQHLSLPADFTFGMFCTQLSFVGLNLTTPLIQGLQNGTLEEKSQDHSKAKWYGRPKPADLFIDWKTMSSHEIKALVKACNPWNKAAATRYNGWTFGITDAYVLPKSISASTPGTVISIDETKGLLIACRDGLALKAEVVYCEEGFYPGHKLKSFGISEGALLGE